MLAGFAEAVGFATAAGFSAATGLSTMVVLAATAGTGVTIDLAPSAPVGVGIGFCGEDLGGGALATGAPGVDALGALGAGAGLGAAGRAPVGAAGILLTSGRCGAEGERDDDGAPAAFGALAPSGALLAAGAPGRGAEGGTLAMTSSESAAETSLGASIAAGGSLPRMASPAPGTLETWIT